ncbi:hypothetical protein DYH56_13665 [Psychrilyobacter piezotolerans]|uniref:Uncharacterized protein n=1 Tax=Psychrilyobacter piezotolerans TaxID=2293438 RepID=A0ABX9KDW4_9FUSO|nr:hypothetical protein DV867_13665 [Psychrilyobacter sp. S5]REI39735.1 hypothetical protein DYH56_13665 [Psychrilyobacter piezotolerans]
MIRFLFFNSMLIGLYFKQNHQNFLNKTKMIDWIITLIMGISYFLSKLLFSRVEEISSYQILNQIILFIFLYYIFKSFLGIEEKLNRIPLLIKKIINFLASITLEIYLVQYIIIPKLSYFIFPLNWVIVSITILISAFILNRISNRCIHFIKIRGEKYENTSNRSI